MGKSSSACIDPKKEIIMEESLEVKRRLEVAEVENEDETCRTFVLYKEDHTLGNSLRYVICKNPEVEFCGYSVPHPSEHKINFRIQTKTEPATEVLKKGLNDLNDMTKHILSTFESAVKSYKQTEASEMDTS